MINDVLTAAGVPYRRGRFINPPAGQSYAVYTDDVETDGPDYMPTIWRHGVSIELYEPRPDDAAEAAIEAALTAAGLQWTKQDRLWLTSEQRYQVIYDTDYIEKRRLTNG